jgi:glycerophosphoryl diester phosphodiesterase
MTINIIHRGNFSFYPENSLMSFKTALEDKNSDGIETDIRISTDGVFYCFHDDYLTDLTNSDNPDIDKNIDELQSYFLKDKFGNITKYKIPTLSSLFILNKFYNKILNLEIKIDPTKYDCDEIIYKIKILAEKYNMINNIFISSFFDNYYFSCIKQKLIFGLLIYEDNIKLLEKVIVPKIIIFDKDISLEIINKYKIGKILGVYTVDENFKNENNYFNIIIRDV